MINQLVHGPFTIKGGALIDENGTRLIEREPQGVRNWDSFRYEAIVLHLIRKIQDESQTGRLIISAFPGSSGKHRVTVVPEPTMDDNSGAAFSPALNVIQFTPAKHDPSSPFCIKSNAAYPILRPDYSLFHEIVHAMEHHRGHSQDNNEPMRRIRYNTGEKFIHPTIGSLEFDDYAELLSICIVNIYVSEKNKGLTYRIPPHRGGLGIRADHQDMRPIFPKGAQDLHTFPSVKKAFSVFLRRYPGLFLKLADIATEFNPFRDYLLDAMHLTGHVVFSELSLDFGRGIIDALGQVMVPVERVLYPHFETRPARHAVVGESNN